MLSLLTLAPQLCASHWTAPAIDGVVVDGSGHPLSDVAIDRVPRNGRPARVTTSRGDGSFVVAAPHGLAIDVLIGDPGYVGEYSFSKPGYADVRLPYGVITGDVLRSQPPVQSGLRIELPRE